MSVVSDTDLLAKSKQLIYFRFVFALVAIFVSLLWRFFRAETDTSEIFFPYVVILFLNAIGLLFLQKGVVLSIKALNALNAFLLLADILALSVLIHLTRGVESDFFLLYLLPILFASNVFGSIGVLITAALASSAYLLVLLLENWSFLPYIASNASPEGLTAAYAQRVFRQMVSRSGILFVLSFIWAVFCWRMSGIAKETMLRLAEQLQNNQSKNLELRQMQSQLIHQEKMASLGRIVAGIAHELNNPINFVHGNLPYLRDYFADLKKMVAELDELPDPARKRVAELKKQINYDFLITDLDNIIADLGEGSERVWQIVRNLRSFSRLDEAELKEASVQEGLESTVKILSQYYGRDKITVETHFSELPTVLCYPGKLNQVWMNLLSNAAQAVSNRAEPRVIIRTECEDIWVNVVIEDNGPGIKAADQSKIFEPFFTTKPVGQGTGLGLSICHAIIERHGGRIWFESQPNTGTKFFVKIPVKAVFHETEESLIEANSDSPLAQN